MIPHLNCNGGARQLLLLSVVGLVDTSHNTLARSRSRLFRQAAALKSTVASTLGVALSSLKNFDIATTTTTPGRRLRAAGNTTGGELTRPQQRRHLLSVDWTVSFEVTQSLASSGSSSASDIATGATTALSSSQFQSAASLSTGVAVAVDKTSLAAV